jgi:hypothetical protein
MALNTEGPFSGKEVSIPVGNTSTALGDPGDNCHTIIVYNPDTSEKLFIGWNAAGSDIRTGVRAARVPPQTSMTIPIGNLSNRVNPGSTELVGQHEKGGSAIIVYITYIYGLES